ncbi:MAG: hypothetical protein ABSC48_09515 [Terracidiphilus sp.]|jgi:hypothetical protein
MPPAIRTFRAFGRSTFEDLRAERGALQREVFPRLRKLYEANPARSQASFQATDLRRSRPLLCLDRERIVAARRCAFPRRRAVFGWRG